MPWLFYMKGRIHFMPVVRNEQVEGKTKCHSDNEQQGKVIR